MIVPPDRLHQIFEQPAPDWVTVHPPAPLPDAPIDGAHYPALLFDTQRHVEIGVTFCRRVIHLPNQMAVQYNSRIEAEFSPEREQLVIHTLQIHRAGEIIDLKPTQLVQVRNREAQMEHFIFDGRLLAVFLLHDVRPGDTIDFSYSLHATKPPLFGKISGRFILRGDFSAKAVRCRIVYHPDRQLYVQPHNMVNEPVSAYTTEGLIECTWSRDDVTPIATHLPVPTHFLPVEWIDYGEFATWEEVGEAATRVMLEPDEPLPPHLAQWVEQVHAAAPSPEAFLLQMIRYVQDNIRYVAVSIDEHACKPYDVATVLARNFGDCKDKSVLLGKFLRHAGYDARPALVHSSFRGHALKELPSPAAFDHAIVRIEHGGQVQWIDTTRTNQGGPFGAMAHPQFEAALVLGRPGASVEEIPTGDYFYQLTHDDSIFVPGRGGIAELKCTRTFRAAGADAVRAQLAGEGVAEMDRKLLADYKRYYPQTSERAPTQVSDDREKNVVTIVSQFQISGFWSHRTGPKGMNEARFAVAGLYPLLHLPPADQRHLPYTIAHPLRVIATFEIHFPNGFRPGRDRGILSPPGFHATYHFDGTASRGQIKIDYTSKRGWVLPNEMAEHEKAIRQLRIWSTYTLTAPDKVIHSRPHYPARR